MYAAKIFRVCLGYFNDVDKAKDLTQETFIVVLEHLHSLKNTENISGWIYRIATNKCLRQLEKEKRHTQVLKEDFAPVETTALPGEETALLQLRQCIRELKALDRILIGLYLEDLPQDKIAEIVGLSHANVRVRIHRIKGLLAKKMKKHER